MEHEADVATEAAKQAVEATEKSVDTWLQERRRMAVHNDKREDDDRERYFKERAEAIRARNARVIEKLRAAGVSIATIHRLLAGLSEELE